MAKAVKVRTSSGQWEDLAVQVPSANSPTFTGTTSSSQFNATNSVGDEGGEINFAKAATNTTLNTGVTLDVYQDKVRLFETGGTNRGGFFDMTTLTAGVGTNLGSGLHLISTTALSGASTTITSIPQTYKDLYLVIKDIRPATNQTNFLMRFNADATAGRHANSTSNSAKSLTFTLTSSRIAEEINNGVSTSLITMHIPDYTNTDTWKWFNSTAISNDAVTITSYNIQRYIGIYNQTTAVTSLEFLFSSGNITSGSLLLYGVK